MYFSVIKISIYELEKKFFTPFLKVHQNFMTLTNDQLETLEIITEQGPKDATILGIILCGSIAKGTSNQHSDIDVFVVVTDEEWQRRIKAKDFFWGSISGLNIYKTFVDGKVVNIDLIKKIGKYGTEPIRSTFQNAKLLYCCNEQLNSLLTKTDIFKINNRNENIKKYYSLFKSNFHKADDDLSNLFLVKQCIIDTVFYACRLTLAYNNILYPCRKNLEKEIIHCPKKPERFIELMQEVLSSFSLEALQRFYNAVESYYDMYSMDNTIRKGYVLENELFWYFNIVPYDEI